MSSKNINVNDSFIRTGDDSISIYGSLDLNFRSANVFNETNSVLMPGNPHPIKVGIHLYPKAPDTINWITVSNVDTLMHNPLCAVLPISLTASESNLVTNIIVSEIRNRWRIGQKFSGLTARFNTTTIFTAMT